LEVVYDIYVNLHKYFIYYLDYSPIATTSYKVYITWQQELRYQNCGHNCKRHCKNRTNLLQGLKMQADICCKHFERFSKT